MPKNKEEWKMIASDFYNQWNFPHCVGSMDGKHIMLQAPTHTGSEYYNYKGFFSIVLFAIVDANYNFIYTNIGCQGRISDGGVFSNTIFKQLLDENKLNLPDDDIICGRQKYVPYVFVADDAFPLKPNIMKPYPGAQEKGSKCRIFNYRLSRARRVIENAFGILSVVFRILRKPLLLDPDKAKKVTLTCVNLHNYLRKSKTSKLSYSPPGTFDVEDIDTGTITPGRWRTNERESTSLLPLTRTARKASMAAQEIRNEICNFFQTPNGRVSWQDNY